VQADGVRFVRDLLALLADPKGTAKRLADIEAATGKLAKAQAKFDADKAAHDTKVATERAGRSADFCHSSHHFAPWHMSLCLTLGRVEFAFGPVRSSH
jgi:hypothetical protein